MRLIGLTGGIGTGKSTFARALVALGAAVVDADVLARAAVAKGTPGLAAIVAAFGEEVLASDGGLDRSRMASRVFADPKARTRLEALVHPAVRALFRVELERYQREGRAVVFYDVPLLFETGLEREVDLVVVVWAPREVQLRRPMTRDRLERAAAEERLGAQQPIDEKASRADLVVANDGAVDLLADKAKRLLDDVTRGVARRLPNAPPARY